MLLIDSLIVSWDFSRGDDTDILLVGHKNLNESVKIINAFQGEKAREIVKMLTEKGVKDG